MSEYAHAVSEERVVFRLRAAKGDLRSCALRYGDRACRANPVVFAAVAMRVALSDTLFDYWEAEFDTLHRRMCYYFELNDGAETLLYYADFFHAEETPERSEYYQLPYVHRADVAKVPDWAMDAVIYNIFPDSFATSRRHISLAPARKEWKGETTRGRLGGAIKGVTENADYLRCLGVNCVYLNPIFAAGEYHKYDLLDYYHVDPCFGTDGDFRELVEALHGSGMRVIIDGVFNHCGWRFFAFDEVARVGEASPRKDWFYRLEFPVVRPDSREAIPGYECFAYERLMPKLDTANAEVREYFCEVCRHWLREYKIDGWRLDVASEVNDGFWRAFRSAADEVNPDALIIGEVWESAGHWLDGSMFNSAMNYDFRKHCRDFFARGSIDAAGFGARVANMLARYRKNIAYAQLNLLDSHDVSRFLTLCGGDRERLKLAVLFQMCFVGIPCVFYGDEQGIAGAAEDEYRSRMVWDGDKDIFGFYKKAIALRRDSPALRRGGFETLLAENKTFAFRRSYNGESVTVALGANEWGGRVIWRGDNFIVTGE
jgi:glycosidase